MTTIEQTSLVASSTNCFAASICSLVPSICTVLSFDISPGGGCRGITCKIKNFLLLQLDTMRCGFHGNQQRQLNYLDNRICKLSGNHYTWIRAPVVACILFIVSPPLPITSPTCKFIHCNKNCKK